MDRNLSILQWNSRSINANKGSFDVALSDLKVDVATINETWLKPNFNFTIANYFPVGADRLDGKGGVMILIKNNINYQGYTISLTFSYSNLRCKNQII